ncbi:hypothetical protein Prum_073220 [Phytohabitans rumicis]|uniref:Uncharacterized protein n=1 Tax=Phytohabitans rumicis TaxID=1076125 RepID=A0A6V8LDF0_9ACTN|nr:hypothetical protein Prum_073220 [Phytohabitans rumicis]
MWVEGVRQAVHWRLLRLYALSVVRTASVTWPAPLPAERRMWTVWHGQALVSILAFVAARPDHLPHLVGLNNRRGHAIRLAYESLGGGGLQATDRVKAGPAGAGRFEMPLPFAVIQVAEHPGPAAGEVVQRHPFAWHLEVERVGRCRPGDDPAGTPGRAHHGQAEDPRNGAGVAALDAGDAAQQHERHPTIHQLLDGHRARFGDHDVVLRQPGGQVVDVPDDLDARQRLAQALVRPGRQPPHDHLPGAAPAPQRRGSHVDRRHHVPVGARLEPLGRPTEQVGNQHDDRPAITA